MIVIPPANPVLTGLAGAAQQQKPVQAPVAAQAQTVRPATPPDKKQQARGREKRDREQESVDADTQRGRNANLTV